VSPMTEEEIILFHRYVCEGIGDPKRLMLLYLVAERARNGWILHNRRSRITCASCANAVW